MTSIATELRNYSIISPFQIISLVSFLVSPLWELRQNTLKVLNTIFAGKHGIITEVLALSTWVVVVSLTAKPQTWVIGHRLDDKLVHIQAILLRIGGICRHVAPLDGPLVIVVDAWEETIPTDIVFWLCHIVETGIVHYRRCMTIGFYPSLIAHLLHRRSTAGALVMTQSKGMSHLMRADEANKLSHKFFIEHLLTGPRIHGTCLNHVPVVYQLHHIMIPTDVALYNLAAARIVYVWSVSIGDRRSQITNHGVTGIFHAHSRIIFGPFLGSDGVLETSLLKSLIPVFHTQNEPLTPLFWSGRVDVIDNLLSWFDEFTSLLTCCILGILRFKAPAGDPSTTLGALLSITIVLV